MGYLNITANNTIDTKEYFLSQSKKQVDFIEMVVDRLVAHFVQPLSYFSGRRNYELHVASLAEIIDWSEDFFIRYFDIISDWERFRASSDNIFEADTLQDFITRFGQERFNMFCLENANNPNYLLEKYSAIDL